MFVDAVAANRGVDAKTVLAKTADGRDFLGKNAIKAGLVDGIETLPKNAPVKTTRKSTAVAATAGETPTADNRPSSPTSARRKGTTWKPRISPVCGVIGTDGIPKWNDAHGRTFPEVREAFLKAISLAEKKEAK